MSDFKISKEKENEIMAYFGEISDLSCGNDPCCACEFERICDIVKTPVALAILEIDHQKEIEIELLKKENAKLREVVGLAVEDLQLCDICEYCTKAVVNGVTTQVI